MSWLAENIPIMSGISVAFLSFLTSFIRFVNDRSIGNGKIKKLKEYTDIYTALPDKSTAKSNIDALLNRETTRLLEKASRKLNITNTIAVIFVAMVGGALSYLLVLWATSADLIVWSMLAWILFAIIAFSTIGLSITGLASMYNSPKDKTKE